MNRSTTINNADVLLSWITHHGNVRKQRCREVWEQYESVFPFSSKSFQWILNNLHYLGYIEVIGEKEQRLVATPPTLLPIGGGIFQWFGARVPSWERVLKTKLNLHIPKTSRRYEPFRWLFRIPEREIDLFDEKIHKIIPNIEIARKNLSLELLKSLPTLCEGIKGYVQNASVIHNIVPIDMKRFTVADDGCRRWENYYAGVTQSGLYHNLNNKRCYWYDTKKGWIGIAKSSPLFSVCCWEIAKSIHEIVTYDEKHQELRVKVDSMRFPLLIERGLHLHSGRVPGFRQGYRCYTADHQHADEVFRILRDPTNR